MLRFDWRVLGCRLALWAFHEGDVWAWHYFNRGFTLHIGKYSVRIAVGV